VRRLSSRFFRNGATGKLVVVQFPNLPLWVSFGATLVRVIANPRGLAATVVAVAGAVGLVVWASLEIGWGESPFRRTLGATVLGITIAMWVAH
jgi:hypothetical protein